MEDDQGGVNHLLVDGPTMPHTAVLMELVAVIGSEDHDGIAIQPQPLELFKELLARHTSNSSPELVAWFRDMQVQAAAVYAFPMSLAPTMIVPTFVLLNLLGIWREVRKSVSAGLRVDARAS